MTWRREPWRTLSQERIDRAVNYAAQLPVIGLVGADIPRALVDEIEAVPFTILPDGQEPSQRSIELLGASASPEIARILDQILDGDLDFLTGVIVSRESQDTLRLYYVLRMLEKDNALAWPVHYLELLHLDRPSTYMYNQRRLGVARQTVARWYQQRCSIAPSYHPDAWSQVARIHHALELTRETSQCRGSEFVEELAQASSCSLDDALQRAMSWKPVTDQGLPVLLTGSRTWTSAVHERIESTGRRVVGEDHAGGALATSLRPEPRGNTPERDLELAIAVTRWGAASATSSSADRAEYLDQLLGTHPVSEVIAVLQTWDQAAAWDIPAQQSVCQQRDVELRIVHGSEQIELNVGQQLKEEIR
ncbi:hypothetical protein [Glutamicibacter sp. NPDC087344]|uniref:hypothetical protein n=1 Tax=Glutamicibacter sp. NPDC087344 TaxID=3363994 RepID=UPI0038266C25